jgi:hypothetical protein
MRDEPTVLLSSRHGNGIHFLGLLFSPENREKTAAVKEAFSSPFMSFVE